MHKPGRKLLTTKDCQIFEKGDRVPLKNFRRKKGLCEQTKYLGPYEIHSYKHRGCYRLIDEHSKIIGPYNQKSFKRYYEDNEGAKSNENEIEVDNRENEDECDDAVTVDQNNNNDDNKRDDESATETAESQSDHDNDEDIFLTQNTFSKELGEFDNISVDLSNYLFDFPLREDEINNEDDDENHDNVRPKRQKTKKRKSSIFEYY